MNTIPILESEIIHRSVDERQFIRVTLPAKFRLAQEGSAWCTLDEMSLGGFSFQAEKKPTKIKVGLIAEACFEFNLGVATVKLDLPICIVKNKSNRVSGMFYELTGEKREVVRYIIGAYLSGEACLFWPFMETHNRLL